MADYYRLEGHDVVPSDLLEWAEFFEKTNDRRVALTAMLPATEISTVFLGLNHQLGDGPPLVFETMVLSDDPEIHGEMERCSTWDEAVAQHARMIARVRGARDRRSA